MLTPSPKPCQRHGTMDGAGQDEQQSYVHQNGGLDGQLERQVEHRDARSFPKRIHDRLVVDVDPKWADVILIVCFFISGLVDSVAFNTYSCFASMQTGNTIFVGLGVSGQPASSPTFGWAKSLTAIVCFIMGAFCFASFHRLMSPLRRWVLVVSFAFQTLLVGITAILATLKLVSNQTASNRDISSGIARRAQPLQSTSQDRIIWVDLVPLALLAFQSAGQVVASRVLKYNELPTVVLTSLFADLMSDAHILTAGLFDDPKRNRRAVAAVMLFTGAVCGGVFTKGWVGLAGALWIAAAIKALMVLAWVLWLPAPEVRYPRGDAEPAR